MIVGVDFDNTIVTYDDLMARIAREWGLIDTSSATSKRAIRDAVRALPDGERRWQELQIAAYGTRIREAEPAEGVKEFFAGLRQAGIPVRVISHKTVYPNLGEPRVNLREAALGWLEANGFFAPELGLEREHVYFESTRGDKIARVAALGVTHFIDDLEETFAEGAFPANVEKILYSREPASACEATAIPEWRDIAAHLRARALPIGLDALGTLAGSPVVSAEPATKGGNSRVYRVRCRDGAQYAAKFYLQPTVEGRSRLDVEFSAVSFMWDAGLRSIPRPVLAARSHQVALYELVEGAAVPASTATADDVRQVVRFAGTLRDLATRRGAAMLPPASEACFSVESLIANIEARLARLHAAGQGPVHGGLTDFLRGELLPAFASLKAWARGRTDASRELDPSKRTLSPSDFGFHNALKRPDGDLVFLDFEYFGWDDPAKTIADFVLHPAMDLTEASKQLFAREMLERFSGDEDLPHRLETVYPLYGLKWCMILLNEFIPKDLARRAFAASGSVDAAAAQTRQLEKARAMLRRVMNGFETFPYLKAA